MISLKDHLFEKTINDYIRWFLAFLFSYRHLER